MKVGKKSVLLQKGEKFHFPAGQLDPGLVRRIGGVRDQGRIPAVQEAERKDKETLGRAQKRKDFGAGIELDSEPPLIPTGNGFLERPVGVKAWIMMMVGMANGIPEGIQEMLGRSYVRVSQPQVDHIAALFPHLGEANVHLRTEVTLKQI
jgi:hypothetical protein